MEKNNKKIFIGIDVSKATLDISCSGKHYKIANTIKDISAFIKKDIAQKNITLVALESTGGYERNVLKLLCESKIPVHRAHPNNVNFFGKASGVAAKTDKLDSVLLERYAAFIHEEKDILYKMPSDNILELQSLRAVERSLEEDLHSWQCREKHGQIQASKHISKCIELIKERLKEVQEDIELIIREDASLQAKQLLLTSCKGVGKKTANILIAELPELGKMNKKEVANLVGVAPRTSESGQKTSKSHIFGGRFFVRKALYMSALVAMRHNETLKVFYERLREREKSAKVALVALMRKLIIHLNSLLKKDGICS